jgi:hypothetical protein
LTLVFPHWEKDEQSAQLLYFLQAFSLNKTNHSFRKQEHFLLPSLLRTSLTFIPSVPLFNWLIFWPKHASSEHTSLVPEGMFIKIAQMLNFSLPETTFCPIQVMKLCQNPGSRKTVKNIYQCHPEVFPSTTHSPNSQQLWYQVGSVAYLFLLLFFCCTYFIFKIS